MIVVGLDLSLTGLGMVSVPGSWATDFSAVQRHRVGTGARQSFGSRLVYLADAVCRWVEEQRGAEDCEVFIEGSIAGKGESFRGQLKLAGAVEHELYRRLGIETKAAEQSSARKLFLGFLPRSARKDTIVFALSQLTPTKWSADEYDAFIAANFGLAELGLPFVSLAEAA